MLRFKPTQTLKAVLAGAAATAQPKSTATFSDAGDSAYLGDGQRATFTGVTPVVIIAAPAADTVRDVDYLSILNLDSADVSVTLRFDDNGTSTDIVTQPLAPGDMLQYVHGAGWAIITATGARKTTGGAGVWGTIGGTLSDQLDLQAALDGKQPLDSDLSSIAGLTPSNNDLLQRKAGAWVNRSIAQLMSDLSLSGTNTGDQDLSSYATSSAVAAGYQPLDSDLTALAGLSIAADTLPYGNGSHTMALTTFTAAARTLVGAADAAAQRIALGLQIGVDVLAYGTTLAALAGTSWAANAMPIGSGAGTVAQISFAANTFAARASTGNLVAKTISDFGLSLIDDADAAAARTTLGLGSSAILNVDTSTLLGGGDTVVPSALAVKTYVDNAVTGLWEMKGATDASANPNYPAANKGDAYVVSVAGKIGGASGAAVDVGDVYVALADNAGGTQASVGTSWIIIEHNLAGALLSANNLSDLGSATTALTNLGLSANGKSLVTAADYSAMRTLLSLSNVTNDAQTKAAIVPNTAPTAGQVLVGNAGGTAYAPVSASGDVTLASTGAFTIGASKVTLAKIANAAANSKLVGSGAAGSGAAYVEITLGTGLSMSGTTLSATGGGTVTATGGNLTSNAIVLGAGTTDTKVVAGITTDGTSALNLGVAGTSVGKVVYSNATSGTITMQPAAGALGAVTLTMPAVTDTLSVLGLNTYTRKQTITQGTANESVLASTGYSLTGSNAQALIDLAGTWNTTGNPVAFQIAIANTASGTTSKFLSFLAGASGATEVFSVNKAGVARAGDGSSSAPGLSFLSNTALGAFVFSTNFLGLTGNSGVSLFEATTERVRISSAVISIGGNSLSAGSGVGSNDVGLKRNNSGQWDITDGGGGVGNLKVGTVFPGATLSTAMTTGFHNIAGAAGAASGVPANTTGFPIYYDSTNNKLMVYNGAWKTLATAFT